MMPLTKFAIFLLLHVAQHLASIVHGAPTKRNNMGTNILDTVEPKAKIIVSVRKRSELYREPWQVNEGLCPPSLCTSLDEVKPRGTGGSVFYNGDIVLDREAEQLIYGDRGFRFRHKRATSKSRSRLWKNGIVPYIWAPDIFPLSKRAIKKAIRHIEANTCIKFKHKKSTDDSYVRFISEPGCWSNIGHVGGEQKLSIGRGCEMTGTAIHELTHALGIWHEHSRPDRDKYIRVMEENVAPSYLPDFNKINKTLATSRGFPYDYESIMHYSDTAFSYIGDQTIQVIGVGKKLGVRIGQRNGLSTLDIGQLRDMYYCNRRNDSGDSVCPKGWVKKGNSCYKFVSKLKYQFSQAWKHCSSMEANLLHIDTKTEDKYIKGRLKKKFRRIPTWRTGGRRINNTFIWHTGVDDKEMVYSAWKDGPPSSFSSMVLTYNRTAKKFQWEGEWLGSYSQLPQYAHPFICEKRSKRECLRLEHADGRDYNGTLDHTISGITCQKWSSQYPHQHKLLPYPYKPPSPGSRPREDGLGDHNFCRNPKGQRRERPWCFTGKKSVEWQYCDVTACPGPEVVQVQQFSSTELELSDDNHAKFKKGSNNRNKNGNILPTVQRRRTTQIPGRNRNILFGNLDNETEEKKRRPKDSRDKDNKEQRHRNKKGSRKRNKRRRKGRSDKGDRKQRQ